MLLEKLQSIKKNQLELNLTESTSNDLFLGIYEGLFTYIFQLLITGFLKTFKKKEYF